MALLGGGTSILALWRPFTGVLFVVFLYFWRPSLWGGEASVTPVAWVTIGTALGWIIRERHKGGVTGAGWLLLIAAAYLFCTLLAPFADEASRDSAWVITKILFFSFLIVRLCDTPRRLSMYAVTVLLGCLWMIKTVLFSWASSGITGDVRIDDAVGQGGGANYIAWILASTLPLLIYKATRGQAWQRWGALALIPLWLASIVATGSRGGFLCTAASVGVCLLMLRQGKAFVLVGALVGALVLVAPSRYWERIGSITLDAEAMDTSSLVRYQNIFIAAQIAKDHPLFGTGLDTFPRVKQRYVGEDYLGGNLVTHNTYLQMASELGIPFLALFMAFNIWLVWRLAIVPWGESDVASQELRWLRVAAVASIAATLVQMGKGDMGKTDYFWWQYAAALAVLEVSRRFRGAGRSVGADATAD